MNTPSVSTSVPQNGGEHNPPADRAYPKPLGSIGWQQDVLQHELDLQEHSILAHQRDADNGGYTQDSGLYISAEIAQQCADAARYLAHIIRAALAALPTAATAQAAAEAGAAAAVGSSYETRPWEAWETP